METNSLEPFQAQCPQFTIRFKTEKYETYFHIAQDTRRFYDKSVVSLTV